MLNTNSYDAPFSHIQNDTNTNGKYMYSWEVYVMSAEHVLKISLHHTITQFSCSAVFFCLTL